MAYKHKDEKFFGANDNLTPKNHKNQILAKNLSSQSSIF